MCEGIWWNEDGERRCGHGNEENSECEFTKILIKRTKVEGGLLLNIIIRKRASILKLLASKDQALLVGKAPCLGSWP